MAKALFIGNGSNKATKAKKVYIGDSNNKARKVKKIYIGDGNNKARLCWSGINGNVVFTKIGVTSNTANKVYYSKNFGAVQEVVLPNTPSGILECKVACSKNRFVAVISTVNSSSYSSIYYSDDCINWTPVKGMTTQSGTYINIRYIEETGYFIIVNNRNIFYSTDGISWNNQQIASEYKLTDIAYGNGVYLVTANNMYAYTITGGLGGTVNTVYDPTGKTNFSCVAYGDGLFVAHKPNEGIYYLNLDSRTWTLATNLTKTITAHDEISIAYGNGMFLVGSTFNGMFYSYDGKTWSSYTAPYRLLKVSFDGEKFLGTSDSSYGYSYDGLNWTYVSHNINLPYSSIAGN